MTIAEIEKYYIDNLSFLYDKEEARSLSYFAIHHICRLSKSQILLKKNTEVTTIDETSLLMILDELKTGKPIQYVTGETEFFGLPFKVNPSVLIPRPETEELVDWILKEVQNGELQDPARVYRIFDIGTGSGCIPITLKKHLTQADVWGIDISDAAIETAIKNAVINHTEVKFVRDDILNPQLPYQPASFNLIVSNPPYITTKEKELMHQNVLGYEPHNALFVPQNDPLLFYKAIVDFAKLYLIKEGLLFFEINEQFGQDIFVLLEDNSFKNIKLSKDLMGKDRMIKATW